MTTELVSRPYQPDPAQCCEACVFGMGHHAKWCEHAWCFCGRERTKLQGVMDGSTGQLHYEMRCPVHFFLSYEAAHA